MTHLQSQFILYNEKPMDPFDDVFHSYGDDMDENEDETIHRDDLYMNIYKNDELRVDAHDPIVEEEQQHLSQKLSQLSTSAEQQRNGHR